MNIKPIILAGGSGTRLWPISKKSYPKQFIKLDELNGVSFFQRTIKRALLLTDGNSDDIIVAINNSHALEYKKHCQTQAKEIGVNLEDNQFILAENIKDTFGLISITMNSIDNDGLGIILPSDHIMEDEHEFIEAVKKAKNKAKESIILFGAIPYEPNTGYGYIKYDTNGEPPYKVLEFKEKPDKIKAQEFIKLGYLWNLGIFFFSKKAYFNELTKLYGDDFDIEQKNKEHIEKSIYGLSNISIDYGLLEKSDNIYVMPISNYWNDLGSFDAIDKYLREKNIENTNIVELESKNNLYIAEKKTKKVALIGMEDFIIIDTEEILFITKKGESQKVKSVLEKGISIFKENL